MRTYDLTTASGRPYRTGEPSLAELKEQLIKTGRLAPSRLLRASRTYRQAGAVLPPRRRHKPLCLQPLCCHPPVLPLQQTPLALSEQLGIHQNTLRRYADEGRIQTIRTPPGQGRYDVDAFLRESRDATLVCYCRVSSAKQRDDLARQVAFMGETYGETYPSAEIVSDTGVGLNFRRKGLVSLLERLHRGDKLRIVVAHRDRFGFELIQWLAEQNGGGIVVLDNTDYSPEQELTQDILAILHTFSCRLHGLRRHRNAIKEDPGVPDRRPAPDTQALV